VELVQEEIDRGEFTVRYFDAGRISISVDFGMHFEAGFGDGGGNEADHDLHRDERFAPPVLADEAEQPMLDLVPLAGSWGQMADGDSQSRLVGKFLEFNLPQSNAGTVAAATVGGDEQALRRRVQGLAHGNPPAADGFDGEGRRVVIDTHTHPAAIVSQIVDSIGCGTA
jgi:hypothetical protein